MSAVVTGVAFSDAAIGLVAFPGAVMSVLRLRGHSAPPLRLRGWNSHCMNWGVGALAFAAFPIAAMLFYGASTLLAAIRGYAGCEIFAVPNWLRARDDQISCPVFTPIDAFEARLRR